MPPPARPLLAVPVAAALLLAPFSPRPAAAQDLSSAEVKRHIERGAEALADLQTADGSWNPAGIPAGNEIGASALCLLALINAGRTADDPRRRQGG